jgi:hypothetical protein
LAPDNGRAKLNQMGNTTSIRELHQTQPVALVIQPHGLGINRNIAA